MNYVCYYNSPLGKICMASDGEALTGLWFEDQKHYASTLSGEYIEKDVPVFEQAAQWLDAYFEGKEPDFTPPAKLYGTAFQKEVWEILRTIPYGKTVMYGEIAEDLAVKKGGKVSARAVGNAVGRNPVSLIVPCHRVIGKDGSLTGYAGGIKRKEYLLKLEGIL